MWGHVQGLGRLSIEQLFYSVHIARPPWSAPAPRGQNDLRAAKHAARVGRHRAVSTAVRPVVATLMRIAAMLLLATGLILVLLPAAIAAQAAASH